MILQTLRKVGNSYVVTIPREEMERLGVAEGDTLAIEARKVTQVTLYELPADLRRLYDEQAARPDFRAALSYLADR